MECYVFFKEVFNMKGKHSVGTHSFPEYISHILYHHMIVNKYVQCTILFFTQFTVVWNVCMDNEKYLRKAMYKVQLHMKSTL